MIMLALSIFSPLSPSILSNSISLQKAMAQMTTSSNLLTYENPPYAFRIQYPSNWEKVEFNQGIEEGHRNIIVNFVSPLEGFSDTFREYLIIEVGDLRSQNISLDQYIKTQISSRRSLPSFELIESTSATLSDNPARKVVYSYSNADIGITKTMELLTIKDDKLYFISYTADATKYSSYLANIQKMTDSFKLYK
jgi:eukaryotic-like serine/threonine-protein kinase